MNKQVTAVGEILFDVYPGYKKLGGAPFNFIYHVSKLTGHGNFVSRIGDDEQGKEILKIINERGFDAAYIQIDSEHKTGTVQVKLDEKKVPDFKIIENRAYDYIELNDKIEKLVSENTDLLYFGTLAQRNKTSRNTIRNLIKKAVKRFCDINIRQNFYSPEILSNSLVNSEVVKLNEDELKLVNDLLMQEPFDLKKTAGKVVSKFNLDILCVTLGGDGAYLFSHEDQSHHSVKVDNIVDTVGAGDAYAAMLCIGYLGNFTLEKTNKLATEFAAEMCKIKGAVPENDNFYNNFREKINNG